MDLNTIYNVDCLEGMKMIPDGYVDLIVTDLPYGVTRNHWDCVIPIEPLWEQYKRIIKENGAIILFGSGMFTADLMESNKPMWRYNLIWDKRQPTGFLNAKRMPLRVHEDILVFYKKPPTYNPQKRKAIRKQAARKNGIQSGNYGEYGNTVYDSCERYPTSIISMKKDTQKTKGTPFKFPTQKPVQLIRYLIETYSNKGEIVLDSCMGSGTTAIAAIDTGRKYIGFEIDHEIYMLSIKRIKNHMMEEKHEAGR